MFKLKENCFRGKRADTSVVILVFLVLFVIGLALFIYISEDDQISQKISNLEILDEIYAKTEILDFYLTEIIDKVGEGASNEAFNTELKKYGFSDGKYFIPELSQAENKNFVIVFNSESKDGSFKIVYTHKFEYDNTWQTG